MKVRYWRFSKCPHEWEHVATHLNAWLTYMHTMFCPHCGCFRKVTEQKSEALINAQKSMRRHGYYE